MKRVWRTAFIAVPVLLVAYFGASLILTNILTTAPNRELGTYTPAAAGLSYSDVSFATFATDHLTLRGWWVPRAGARNVLIATHPKKTNREWGVVMAHTLWAAGYSVLYMDLRGHGTSDGDFFSYGQYEQYDIVGAVAWVKAQGYAPGSIGLIGWSMGAASSIMAASVSPDVGAVVSDSAYARADDFIGHNLGLLLPFAPGVTAVSHIWHGIDYDISSPVAAIARLGNCRVLLIHGANDDTVPLNSVYQLKAAGGTHVSDTWVVPNVQHVSAYGVYPDEYNRRVLAFLSASLHN